MRGKHGLGGGGVGQTGWGVPTPHQAQFIDNSVGGRLGEIHSLYLPLPLYIYNSRFQGYAPELYLNQKNQNVNKEEE